VGEAVRLAPPPGVREPCCAPVLLAVDVTAGEVDPLAAEHGVATCPAAQQPGVPVLVQGRHRVEDAGAAEPSARPPERLLDDEIEPVVGAEVDPDRAIIGDEGGAGTGAETERVGACSLMSVDSQGVLRMTCQAE